MLKALTHNLTRLATFNGRDSRDLFWPYACTVFLVIMGIMFVIMSVRMIPLMAEMHQFALNHPDQATITTGPGSYHVTIEGNHPEITKSFTTMTASIFALNAWMCVAGVLLYGAAIARRLHDRGASAFWGLLPLPFLTVGLVAMPKLFAAVEVGGGFEMKLFFLIFFNNVAYIGGLAALIVLLSKRSDPHTNRYGPPRA